MTVIRISASGQAILLREYREKFDPITRIETDARLDHLQFLDPESCECCATPATDVWSFGAIVFFCLSGELPFIGEDERELLANMKLHKLYYPKDFSSSEVMT